MIRPVTFVSAFLALSSGAWMFVVKHQAEQLDQQIGGVTAQIRASEQRIRVLRAEWALEIDPNRLATLSALFMPQLKPMLPDQLVSWQELADRLPSPGAEMPHLPLPPALPFDVPDTATGAGAPIALNAAPSVAVSAAPASPAREAAPIISIPVQAKLASARGTPSHHVTIQTPPIRHVAMRISHPSHHTTVRPALRPIPLGESVLGAASSTSRPVRPMGARLMTITARAEPQPRRLAAPAPEPILRHEQPSGSVFGGYANLPPPRPIASNSP